MEKEISIDVILSCPFFWKGSKICEFFTAAHKYIHDTSDQQCKHFKEKLDTDANSARWFMWNEQNDWKIVLGEEQYELVTTFLEIGSSSKPNTKIKQRKAKKSWDTCSVVELLGLIRNKHEHNGCYSDEAKRKLGWFQVSSEVLQFDQNLYAKYWTEKFPRLTFFLWVYFYEFKKVPTLKSYYPITLQENKLWNFDDLSKFYCCVTKALQIQLDKGAVFSRYNAQSNGNQIILEFQALSSDQMTSLIGQSLHLESIICHRRIDCNFEDQKGDVVNFQHSLLTNKPIDQCSVCTLLVFAHKISDLGKRALDKTIECQCGSACTRVVIFTSTFQNYFDAKKSCTQFAYTQYPHISENEVCLLDVGDAIRKFMEKHGEIILQGTTRKLCKVLPVDSIYNTKCINTLSGYTLNQILKENTPEIFTKLKLPDIPNNYIERSFKKTVLVKQNILRFATTKNVFVVLGISQERLKLFLNCKPEDVYETKTLSLDTSFTTKYVILLQETENSVEKTLSQLIAKKECQQNLHILSFIVEETFKWLGTFGSPLILEQNSKNFTKDCTPQTESQFLENLRSDSNNEKLVLIADTPGMGKSFVLASCALQMAKQFSNSLVIHTSVVVFAEKMHNFHITDQKTLLSAIIALCCKTDFETQLMLYWLNADNQNLKPQIVLMLDGLDEANNAQQRTTIEAVKMLHNHLSNVRIWIAHRSHMIDELGLEFGLYGYRLIPFSLENQIELCVSIWREYLKSRVEGLEISRIDLYEFARKCVETPISNLNSEITKIPLMCRLVAETYEEKISKKDFTLHAGVGPSDIYEKIIERKLEIYLKGKCGLEKLSMNHIVATNMRDTVERWHTYFALKLIFSENVASKFQFLLESGSALPSEIDNTILQIGIVEKLNPLMFIHRTFAEYIVARFAYKIINNKVTKHLEMQKSLNEFVWIDVFKADVLDRSSFSSNMDYITSRRYGSLCYPTVCKFLDEMLFASRFNSVSPSDKLLWRLGKDIFSKHIHTRKFSEQMPQVAFVVELELENLFQYLITKERNLTGLFVFGLRSQNYSLLIDLIKSGTYFQSNSWSELSAFDKRKFEIIHWAFYTLCKYDYSSKDKEILKFLELVASLNANVFEEKAADGTTPLMMLCRSTFSVKGYSLYYQLIEFLSDNLQVSINHIYDDGSTICHFPFEPYAYFVDMDSTGMLQKYIFLLEFFMKNERNRFLLNLRNEFGLTPLLSSIDYFHKHRMACSDDDAHPFFCLQGNSYTMHCLNMIRLLNTFKTFGADFNAKFFSGRTSLHLAIEAKFDEDVTRTLINLGSNIYERNTMGQTSLHLVVKKKNLDLFIDLVLKLGVDLYICDYQGKSVLDYGVLQFIVCEICNQIGDYDKSMFTEFKSVIKYIVDVYPSCIEIQDSFGITPLLLLMQKTSRISYLYDFSLFVGLVKFFVEDLKANINVRDSKGNTVFHFLTTCVFNRYINQSASYSKALLVFRQWLYIFLKNGFNKTMLNKINSMGKAPLSLIMENFTDHPQVLSEVFKVFYKFGADLEIRDGFGNTPLLLAVLMKHDIDIVLLLLEQYKVNVCAMNYKGECALSLAVKNRNIHLIQILLQFSQLSKFLNLRKMIKSKDRI